MPVFQCTSCGRLLCRPEEFLGRAWQCPACGPTTVSAEPVHVPVELALLLEDEFRQDGDGTLPPPPSPQAVTLVPPRTPGRRRFPGRRPGAAFPLGEREMVAWVIAGVVVAGLLFGWGASLDMPFVDFMVRLGAVLCLGGLALVAVLTPLALMTDLLPRRVRTESTPATPGGSAPPAQVEGAPETGVREGPPR
jgi:hypothetical protein